MSVHTLPPRTARTIREAARATAATWPSLTPEQVEQLRALLSRVPRDTDKRIDTLRESGERA